MLVHRTRKPRVPVAFLVQAPCGLFDWLSNVMSRHVDPKAGMEHGGRGFRAGQTALSAACAVPMCSWDSTQSWIVRLVHLWRFQPCCLLLLRVMVFDLGFPLVGTMVTSTESFQTPFTIELWVIVDPANIHSSFESRPVAILVGSFPRWSRICSFCLISRTSLWYPRMERTISWILK